MNVLTTMLTLVLFAMTLGKLTKTELSSALNGEQLMSVKQSTSVVQCAIQAFGTGLDDKGIRVQVQGPGFFCGNPGTSDVTAEARFRGGEAEVLVSLPGDDFRLCFQSISIWVTLPYSCQSLNRLITLARWGFLASQLGSCRAFKQRCGAVISNSAVPYVDMFCRRPSNYLGGRVEEMRLTWAFTESDDKC